MSTLEPLDDTLPKFLSDYVPKPLQDRPFVTLTYAQSLDARIAAGPGQRTAISSPATKTMTHYLRAHHDAILIGCGTAMADDPGLDCRFPTANSSPQPIILDPQLKWDTLNASSRILKGPHLPIIFTSTQCRQFDRYRELKDKYGIQVLMIDDFRWSTILEHLHYLNIKSVMVEGGAAVINSLLKASGFIDSLIITVGSTFLGEHGVPAVPIGPKQLTHVKWWTGEKDAVLAARLAGNEP